MPPFPTMMERLLIPIPEKGYQVPNKQGLRDEILTILSAGNDTTGISNTVTIFNVLNDSKIHSRLLAELKTVLPTPESTAPYSELEKLPYLVCHRIGDLLSLQQSLRSRERSRNTNQTVVHVDRNHQRRTPLCFTRCITNSPPRASRRRHSTGWTLHPRRHTSRHVNLPHPLQRHHILGAREIRPGSLASPRRRNRRADEVHGRLLTRQPIVRRH